MFNKDHVQNNKLIGLIFKMDLTEFGFISKNGGTIDMVKI